MTGWIGRPRRATAVGAAGLLLLLALAACSDPDNDPAETVAPNTTYAPLLQRDVKALDPEKVRQLLEGEGAGYALAAELNHYPGPRHVLDLGRQLELSGEQERAVQETFARMRDEARRLGAQLVDVETQLDRAFAAGTVSHDEMARLTSEAAAVEGRLRAVHLSAHLRTAQVLTPDQNRRYDELRGYSRTLGHDGANHDGHGHN